MDKRLRRAIEEYGKQLDHLIGEFKSEVKAEIVNYRDGNLAIWTKEFTPEEFIMRVLAYYVNIPDRVIGMRFIMFDFNSQRACDYLAKNMPLPAASSIMYMMLPICLNLYVVSMV